MIRSKLAFALAIVAVACLGVASTQAANINMTVDYAGSFDAAFNPLPGSPPAPLNSQNAPHSGAPGAVNVPGAIHQFDVFMAITNTAAGEDFQSVIFDMQLGPGVTPNLGWAGEEPQVDPPGPAVGNGPLYSQTGDAGPSNTDLKAITVIASNTGNHARTHTATPGEAGGSQGFPTKLGAVFVNWDGTFGGDMKSWISVVQPENVLNPWSTVIGNTGTAQTASTMTTGPREEWVGVTGQVFIVDDLALSSGRIPGALITAGPLSTNDEDPDAGIAWLLESFTGPGGAVAGATVGATSGVFNWQSQGSSAKGLYTAVIRGTNDDTPTGTDTGNLTFRLVPEPATLSLLGLAMLGLLGVTRRR